jgi:hypothetical protein
MIGLASYGSFAADSSSAPLIAMLSRAIIASMNGAGAMPPRNMHRVAFAPDPA